MYINISMYRSCKVSFAGLVMLQDFRMVKSRRIYFCSHHLARVTDKLEAAVVVGNDHQGRRGAPHDTASFWLRAMEKEHTCTCKTYPTLRVQANHAMRMPRLRMVLHYVRSQQQVRRIEQHIQNSNTDWAGQLTKWVS